MKILKNKVFIVITSILLINTIFILVLAGMIIHLLIGSITSTEQMKTNEEEQLKSVRSSNIQTFQVTGNYSKNKYILDFSFAGWKIRDIELKDVTSLQVVNVSMPGLSGSREDMAYMYFVQQGFTPEGACGLIANIAVESAHTFSATVEEGFADYRGETVIGKGFGICQWTNTWGNPYDRRYKLIDYMKSKGFSPSDDSDEAYIAQLEYAITEPGYEGIVSRIKTSSSARTAAEIWCREWERPANVDLTAAARGNSAEDYFKKYKNFNTDALSASGKEVELRITINKTLGGASFDGTLNGIPLRGSLTLNAGKGGSSSITGSGKYGKGVNTYSGKADENNIPTVPYIRQARGYWNPETREFEHTDWPEQSWYGGTFKYTACSVCCASMALSYITGDEVYNPAKMGLSTLVHNNFLGWLDPVKENGIKYKYGITFNEALEALDEGNMVIALLTYTYSDELYSTLKNHGVSGGSGYWAATGAGHFILLIGRTEDGNIAVNDPGWQGLSTSYWYNNKITFPPAAISAAWTTSSTIVYVSNDD